MKTELVLKEALEAVTNDKELCNFAEPQRRIMELLNNLIKQDTAENIKIEKATILVSGFCRAIPESLTVRQKLAKARRDMWGEKFGSDTVHFMNKSEGAIDVISEEFKKIMVKEYIKQHENKTLYLVT